VKGCSHSGRKRSSKKIRGFDGIDSCQAHFLHQTVLQCLEQSLDAPFCLGTVRRDPFDPQFAEGLSELRAGFFSP
jgi:hypothetical protein